VARGRGPRTGIGSCWRRRWTKFSAGTIGVQIAGDASAARAVRIVIVVIVTIVIIVVVIIVIVIIVVIIVIVIVKYDWLLCALISSCLV
jgi:hypothetical protein